jgi:hypothetical protein
MKKIILLLIIINSCYSSFSQSSNTTLDVVSWNIEWFGATGNGPSNKNLQEQNVVKVLRYLNADIYGICEVVDTMRFRRVVDSLGSDKYAYQIADFGTNATTPYSSAWLSDQKTAFIYDKNIFSNVSFRAFMSVSPSAYSNWATGRLPYLMSATATINGVAKNINFFLLHAKSGATSSDYSRRAAGAIEMKDSIDKQFPNSFNLIIGDYNDILSGTICTSCGALYTSSFDVIVKDSVNYKSLTLPLQLAGKTSEIGYSNSVIDNHVVSAKGYNYYVANSIAIKTDVTNVVSNYTSGNTSDHYPVFSQYNLSTVVTAINNVTLQELGIKTFPNPFTDKIYVNFGKNLQDAQLNIIDITGRIISQLNRKTIYTGETVQLSVSNASAGIYLLQIKTPQLQTVVKLKKE